MKTLRLAGIAGAFLAVPLLIAADFIRFAAVISVPIAAWCGGLTITQLFVTVALVATVAGVRTVVVSI